MIGCALSIGVHTKPIGGIGPRRVIPTPDDWQILAEGNAAA
jgi:hypothetical protein